MARSLRNLTSHSLLGYDALRIGIGVLLLAAAGLKTHELATRPLLTTGLFDSKWLLVFAIEMELLLGLWSLARLWPKVTWIATVICFGLFAGISLYKALSGHATCGCFGRVSVNPWYTTTLDSTIVLLLLRWRPDPQKHAPGTWVKGLALRGLVVILLFGAIGIPVALAIGTLANSTVLEVGDIVAGGQIVVLKPNTWLGKRFPLLQYIDIGRQLTEGEWLLVLYHHDCPDCQKVMRDLQGLVREYGISQVATIEMPPYGDGDVPGNQSNAAPLRGRLVDSQEWFVQTPVVAVLKDGRITATRQAGRST